ncbi:acyltransferase family protein [Frigidibacter sp. MR17.24]|uniref:acyltransferase family protein n=1 Tax=Frigidibacter sp. MR17.24 TaxID=3127345 RepID=UPI003012ABDD
MPALDTLRALAVALVLYTHYLPEPYWYRGVYWGEQGVRLFFVLSGFLITGLLLDRDRLGEDPLREFGRFMLARLARLYPCLLLYLLAFRVLGGSWTWQLIPWDAVYLTNLRIVLWNSWGSVDAHLWSLSVEQQFYLVWPWVIALVPRRWLPGAVLLAIGGALAFRSAWSSAGLGPFGIWVLPMAHLDSLGLGALVAVALRRGVPHRVLVPALLAASALGWGLSAAQILPLAGPRNTAAACLFAAIVLACARRMRAPAARVLLEAPPLVYLGRISYGIYVYHQLAPRVLAGLLDRPVSGVAEALACAALTVVIAAASHALVEQPIRAAVARRLRRQPDPDPDPAGPSVPAPSP